MRVDVAPSGLLPEQHAAARVVGVLYLVMMVTGIFAEMYARARLDLTGDAVQNAANFLASERMFRIGTVADLITFAGDVVLVWALYVVLRPVNRNLALLALCWRMIECAINAAIMLNDLVAVRLLGGADYLRAFDARQLQALARFFITMQGWGFLIGFVFFGLGSAVFAYVWFQSGYIPRLLAGWGVFSGVLVTGAVLLIMVFPGLSEMIYPYYFVPVFIFEVTMGFWLLVKGVRGQVVV